VPDNCETCMTPHPLHPFTSSLALKLQCRVVGETNPFATIAISRSAKRSVAAIGHREVIFCLPALKLQSGGLSRWPRRIRSVLLIECAKTAVQTTCWQHHLIPTMQLSRFELVAVPEETTTQPTRVCLFRAQCIPIFGIDLTSP
jgi:hypothetical protein